MATDDVFFEPHYFPEALITHGQCLPEVPPRTALGTDTPRRTTNVVPTKPLVHEIAWAHMGV